MENLQHTKAGDIIRGSEELQPIHVAKETMLELVNSMGSAKVDTSMMVLRFSHEHTTPPEEKKDKKVLGGALVKQLLDRHNLLHASSAHIDVMGVSKPFVPFVCKCAMIHPLTSYACMLQNKLKNLAGRLITCTSGCMGVLLQAKDDEVQLVVRQARESLWGHEEAFNLVPHQVNLSCDTPTSLPHHPPPPHLTYL